jgi:hypothetical protein
VKVKVLLIAELEIEEGEDHEAAVLQAASGEQMDAALEAAASHALDSFREAAVLPENYGVTLYRASPDEIVAFGLASPQQPFRPLLIE